MKAFADTILIWPVALGKLLVYYGDERTAGRIRSEKTAPSEDLDSDGLKEAFAHRGGAHIYNGLATFQFETLGHDGLSLLIG